ncbi:DUF4870 domain-containing protein [Salipaludibacillus agaradhaerens]|uniref:DUF4870 domain-containing protein n=1 Tax=Salipaludibacillus agaradhaerens TaxID=76935 RepID=UPI0009961EF0|nr:DUF4870 domain-containing protein [Salipaludibacillus agaradhaerens]
MSDQQSYSSTGLTNNIGGLLAYSLTFITGIIFIVIEKENKFIRFHAMQSIMAFVPLYIFTSFGRFIPFAGLLFSFLTGMLMLVFWILGMLRAYKGEIYKFPIVGNLAAKQLN